jgi:hypothetical protein
MHMDEQRTRRTIPIAAGLAALLLATTPIFFDIYRTAAFNTIPRDDYAPYLLALTGQGGQIPGAPFAYRILSVVAAAPFYYALPAYTFSNLRGVDASYLKATQALSFASYLWLVLTALVIYAIARRQYSASRAACAIVALLTFLLSGFIARTGVDPFAILVIGLLLLWQKRAALFIPLVLVSVGINEKIPIVFAGVMLFRLIAAGRGRRRFDSYPQLLSSCVAIACYFVVVQVVKAPGHANQLNPGAYWAQFQSTIGYTLSLKGLVLNVIPVLVLLFVIALSARCGRPGVFRTSDVSGLVILVALASIADVDYNVGRIAMYSYPLYIPALAGFVDDALDSAQGTVTSSAADPADT